MNKKKIHLLTNILFYIGIAVSLVSIGKTYYDRRLLPERVAR